MSETNGVDVGDISHLEARPPLGVQVRASIHILLTDDGRVLAKSDTANRLQFNLMIETAKQDLVEKFKLAERQLQGSGLVVAPPGSRLK